MLDSAGRLCPKAAMPSSVPSTPERARLSKNGIGVANQCDALGSSPNTATA